MRHDWFTVYEGQMPYPPQRRCKNCGAFQQRETNTSWMRVTGYQWLPLVGRCKTKESNNGK